MDTNATRFITRFTHLHLKMWNTIDHRVDGWLLMTSIQPATILIVAYLSLVYFGPKLMKNRQPFVLKAPMIYYNTLITLFNLYLTTQFIIGAARLKYDWSCHAHQSEVEEMRIIRATHLMFLTKLIEWLDTAFFILRKKENQLTFLHVYHHVSIFVIGWLVTRFIPSEETFLTSMLNSGIHVIMYTYYTLAALGPMTEKYLWWKKYLTTLQLTQFVAVILIECIVIMRGCSSYQWIHLLLITYFLSIMYLFKVFYQKTYIYKTKTDKRN